MELRGISAWTRRAATCSVTSMATSRGSRDSLLPCHRTRAWWRSPGWCASSTT
ncbi:hypothetical protein NKH77_52400 [Streptomyces sp. M19]